MSSIDMTSALKRPGWLTFASVVLLSVGFYRIISAIAYFADSHKVNNLTGGLFGSHLFWWGIWDLAIAGLALYAGYSLLNGDEFGRVIGYIWGIVVIVQSFTIMGVAPWYGVAAMTVGFLVMYALSATGEWRGPANE